MNRKAIRVFVAFAVLVGLAGGLLLRVRANLVLGKPGVKVANIPIYVVSADFTNIASNVSVPLPVAPLDYLSEPLPVTTQETGMLPPDTVYGRRMYQASDGLRAMISVVLMGTDRTSIHKPQYCLVGQGQTIVGSELIRVRIPAPYPYDLPVMKLTTASDRRMPDGSLLPVHGLFLYWFVADGQLTARHGERMWLMGRDLLTKGLLQRWAYVAVWSQCAAGREEELLKRMKELIAATVPEFQLTAGRPLEKSVAANSAPEPWSRN